MTDTIHNQIIAIRDSGETNMLDMKTVQRIADREGYHELFCYIEDFPNWYFSYICTGSEGRE